MEASTVVVLCFVPVATLAFAQFSVGGLDELSTGLMGVLTAGLDRYKRAFFILGILL